MASLGCSAIKHFECLWMIHMNPFLHNITATQQNKPMCTFYGIHCIIGCLHGSPWLTDHVCRCNWVRLVKCLRAHASIIGIGTDLNNLLCVSKSIWNDYFQSNFTCINYLTIVCLVISLYILAAYSRILALGDNLFNTLVSVVSIKYQSTQFGASIHEVVRRLTDKSHEV